MRGDSSFAGDSRSSALWGKGSNGETRRSALWGKGGRSAVASLSLVVAFMVPVAAASADGGSGSSNSGSSSATEHRAVVPGALLKAAESQPDRVFHVIVQGSHGKSSDDVKSALSGSGKLKKKFMSISGIAADIDGKDLLKLARHPSVLAITPDVVAKTESYQNNEVWRDTVKTEQLARTVGSRSVPAIAIVDSGVDASRVADFGGRVIAQADMTGSGSTSDDYGHGTLVAGLAAGASATYPGAAKTAPIVSLRVSGGDGRILTSSLIAAVDFILANKDQYRIGVANFSTRSAGATSFRIDPLDKAVEKLVFNNIVVVAAGGNHGNGSKVNMSYAPGNDPFVITVGATDTMGSSPAPDDTVPSWSAFGRTADGFGKPDIAAPGRYLIGPAAAGSTIAIKGADRMRAPGYMWMSGTSLSTAIVSGIAAQLRAARPDWSVGQVKGALMATAVMPLSAAATGAAGNGVVNAAAAGQLLSPPNANAALERFVSNGTFDATAFASSATGGLFSTDWYMTDWYATDWYATDWYATDWYATDWFMTDWYATDWYATDWFE